MATKKKSQPVKRGRKSPPVGENKRDRFKRLCKSRMDKAVNAIDLLGNLSAPHYHWNTDDLDAMHKALMDAVERTFSRFETTKRQRGPHFKLPS